MYRQFFFLLGGQKGKGKKARGKEGDNIRG
jgi:hypothetical protein